MAANKYMLTTPANGPKIKERPRISAVLSLVPANGVRETIVEIATPWAAASKKSAAPTGRVANSRNTRRGLSQTSFSGRMGSVVDTQSSLRNPCERLQCSRTDDSRLFQGYSRSEFERCSGEE